MKRTLTALAVAAMMAGASHAVTADSESLVLSLNGEIASNCELIPEGTASYTVDMGNFGNQGFAVIAYSCNSPYTLSLSSLNGGMSHFESGGALVVDYAVETFGFSTGPQSFTASAMTGGSTSTVDQQTSWANIFVNGGAQAGNLDLVFPGFANSAVAGTYTDELTVTLTADL